MFDRERTIDQLMAEATSNRWNRRQIMKRGLALGLSIAAVKRAFASHAFAQASPTASGVVPIVGREMTADEIKAAIQAEGEVTVGNWTYTAIDQLVQRFKDYVQQTYGVGIGVNYVASQTASTYLTDIYTAF